MEMQPVKSDAISHIGYDRNTQTMHVRFTHGSMHAFEGVPEHAHQAFLSAPSIGKHFHQHVRSKFRSKKL